MNNLKGDKLFTINIGIEDLKKLILEIDNIIKYYPDNYLKELGEEYILRKILSKLKEEKYIDNKYIETLAKENNEKNNKALIIEKPKFKKWSFAWFINIFTGKNEIIKDTKEFDKAEKVLFNEYLEIGNSISKYFEAIEKIKNNISNESYEGLLNTFFNLGNVNSELNNILEDKKALKNNIEIKEQKNIEKTREIIEDNSKGIENKKSLEYIKEISFKSNIDNKNELKYENNIHNNNKANHINNGLEISNIDNLENKIESESINNVEKVQNITDEDYIKELSNKETIKDKGYIEELSNKEIIEDKGYIEELSNKEVTNNEIVLENKESINEANENLKSILISEVFSENIFRIFLNYCEENNIITLSQIVNFDFSKLDNIKGFGVGKKKKLIEKYNDVMNNYDALTKKDSGEEIEVKENEEEKEIEILPYYRTLDISVINGFNKINDKLISQLKEYEINTLEELYIGINKDEELISNLTNTKIKNINLALENFKIESYELFNLLIDKFENNEDYNILIQRAVYDKTLNEIGEEYGVSRERIRQKEKKLIISISNVLNMFMQVSGNEEVRFGNVAKILGLDNITSEREICLTYVLKNSDISGVEYYKELNKFIINSSLEELKNEIKDILDNFSDIIAIDNELNENFNKSEKLSILNTEDLLNICISVGYEKVNNYLFKNGVTKSKIYNFIVKEFFKDGIVFSKEEDLIKFKEILKEKFKIQEDSERNIKAKVESHCILIDRASYIHPDLVEIDEEILDDIKDYIDNNHQETLYTNQIFSEFEDRLISLGIPNRYYLHGVLGYYFKGEYKFTRDTITRGNIMYSRNYIFNKYVEEKGGVVTKEDLEKDLKGWTPIMFIIALEECRHILKWDNGGVIHASFIKATLEDINRIKEELDNLFDSGVEYITDQDVFEKFELKFKEFLSNNLIDNKFKMFSVLEYILGRTYYFRRPYILKNKPKEAVSAVYLMKKLFIKKSVVTMEEIKDYCFKIKLNDTTRMSSINKLLKETIEIEKDTYILKENFEIETEAIDEIKNILINMIEEKGYLALKNITDYSKFPKINFEWNIYLLKDICEKYISEVKVLKRQFNDKRYIAPVIVKEESDINELLDLIYDILINQFNDKEYVAINDLEKYLRDNNIIYDSIPFEIYNCEKISIQDNKIIF